MVDCFEHSFLEKKSAWVSSADQKKARQLLVKEITELLNDARQQFPGNSSSDLAVTTESQMVDLSARTETLINVLQSEGNT